MDYSKPDSFFNFPSNEHLDQEKFYQDFINPVSEKVLEMLTETPDLLFSYLYRMDIDETKIKWALAPEAKDEAHIGLAKLILERQLQRIQTQKQYPQHPTTNN